MSEATSKKEKRITNTIHDDSIWRQKINYELQTAKNWNKNWGFMRDAMLVSTESNDLKNSSLENIRSRASKAYSSGLPSKLPSGLVAPDKPSDALDPSHESINQSDGNQEVLKDWLYCYQINRVIKYRYPDAKYTFPATTSSEIGWSWTNVQKKLGIELPPVNNIGNYDGRKILVPGPSSLERHGKYARGRGDVLKWFGGCNESLP